MIPADNLIKTYSSIHLVSYESGLFVCLNLQSTNSLGEMSSQFDKRDERKEALNLATTEIRKSKRTF